MTTEVLDDGRMAPSTWHIEMEDGELVPVVVTEEWRGYFHATATIIDGNGEPQTMLEQGRDCYDGTQVVAYLFSTLSARGYAPVATRRPGEKTRAEVDAERDQLRREVGRLGLRIAEQRKELARLSLLAVDAAQVPALYAQRDALAAQRDALRAILAGRAVAPTPQEIDAHHAAGGAWLLVHDTFGGRLPERLLSGRARSLATLCGPRCDARWWALDASGLPCAWPDADPALAEGRSAEMAALLCPVCDGLLPEAMPDTPEAATAACRCQPTTETSR